MLCKSVCIFSLEEVSGPYPAPTRGHRLLVRDWGLAPHYRCPAEHSQAPDLDRNPWDSHTRDPEPRPLSPSSMRRDTGRRLSPYLAIKSSITSQAAAGGAELNPGGPWQGWACEQDELWGWTLSKAKFTNTCPLIRGKIMIKNGKHDSPEVLYISPRAGFLADSSPQVEILVSLQPGSF